MYENVFNIDLPVGGCRLLVGHPAASGEKRIPVATSDEGKVPVGKLKPGDASPEFMAVDSNRRLVSLKDFKGKYVYVDLWATWCSPCVGQIPHLQRLEKLFKGKKIVFVSISCDEDVDEWLGVSSKEQDGRGAVEF